MFNSFVLSLSLNVELFMQALQGDLVHPDFFMLLLDLSLALFDTKLFISYISLFLIEELVLIRLV